MTRIVETLAYVRDVAVLSYWRSCCDLHRACDVVSGRCRSSGTMSAGPTATSGHGCPLE